MPKPLVKLAPDVEIVITSVTEALKARGLL